MRHVVWAQHAHRHFLGAIDYIAQDNPAAAARVARRIDRTIRALVEAPTGRVADTYERVVPGLPYIVAYTLGDEPRGRETITVLRVIHGARDWPVESWPE